MQKEQKTLSILQSNYIPWKGYFDLIRQSDQFILYDDAQYTKNDWRNRNRIKTANGLKWLTIPIQTSGKLTQKISEAEVSEKSWAESHWAIFKQAYKGAPFFSDYEKTFEGLYAKAAATSHLSKINRLFIDEICRILEIKTTISWSSDFTLAEGKTDRLVELCRTTSSDRYLSGPSAKDYLEVEKFARKAIQLSYIDYSGYPTYRQLHGAFCHEVSVLDLIFNEGASARKFLEKAPILKAA